jgi:hypothetical protein
MRGLRSIAGVLMAMALGVAACSSNASGPKPIDGVLLHASDVSGMRLAESSASITAPTDLADPLGHGEIFKIDPSEIASKLSDWGLVRAHLERFVGGGTHAEAGVLQFASAADARTALAFMFQQLFEQCPGEPQCSTQLPLSVPNIPGAKGQIVTPVVRDPNFGKPVTDYKVLFTIGSLIYAIDVGGDMDFYDPATMAKSTALAVFKDVYDRVNGLSPDAVFNGVPKRPLGPPPGGAVSISPPPGASPSP